MPLKIIFAATPEFSVPPLQALIESEHEVVAVYCQPDRPAGRGRKLLAGPVKQLALDHQIPVYQPLSLKEAEAQDELKSLNADLMVVVAYGLILPQAVLEQPRFGCINIHASILPRWRGAAPIQRAILAGDKLTGITIMQMDVGLDTGDMLLKTQCEIAAEDTGSSLHDRLSVMGAEALMQILPSIVNQQLTPIKQNDEDSCYAAKLNKSEAVLDWSLPATQLVAKVQAFNAWPVAQTTMIKKSKIQILRIWNARVLDENSSLAVGTVLRCNKQGLDVVTGESVLRILELQTPGGKPMDIKAFVNAHDLTGDVLGLDRIAEL